MKFDRSFASHRHLQFLRGLMQRRVLLEVLKRCMAVDHIRLGSIRVQVDEVSRLCVVCWEVFLKSTFLLLKLFYLAHIHIVDTS